jgi:hypothetical protein
MRNGRGWGESADGAAYLQEDARSPQMPGSGCGTPGGQVGPASVFEVERFEPSRSLQEQRGSIVAVTRGEGGVTAQKVDPGVLEPVERSGLGRSRQLERCVKCAGPEARFRRGQRALGAPRRIDRKLDGPLQERRCRGDAAASLRAAGRPLQFGRHLLI